MTFTLEQVHPVQAKAFYFDDGVGRLGAWFGGGRVDEEGGCGASAIFYVWNMKRQRIVEQTRLREGYSPTARIVSVIAAVGSRVDLKLLSKSESQARPSDQKANN